MTTSKCSTTTTQKTWKVAEYIRLSKEDGGEVSYSVANQRECLTMFLRNFEGNSLLVDTYIDDGYTGTDSNRHDFQRMLNDIKAKRINCVIVKDLSRLSRNYIEAGQYLEYLFVDHDVRFISLELPQIDSYKSPDSVNNLGVIMQNVVNDDFCRQTSIKIRRVFNTKRANGEFIGAFAPYGYQKDPADKHHLIIDEETSQIVRQIFDWYVHDGMSKAGIVKKLNALEIPNPTEYKKRLGFNYTNPHSAENDGMWSAATVTRMLENQLYLGHMVQGRYRVKSYKVHKQFKTSEDEWFIKANTHESIVSQELYDQAQILMAQRTKAAENKNEVYLFSGFLRCADCQKVMTHNAVQGGQHVYYHCRTYREKSKEACTKHTIRLDRLEKADLHAIRQQLSLALSLAEIVEEINRVPEVRNQSQRLSELKQSHCKELEKARKVLDGLYMDWKTDVISGAQFLRMREKLEQQEKTLTGAICAVEEEERRLAESGINSQNSYLAHFVKHRNIDHLERSTLVDLAEAVFVHEGGEITVVFRFQDQYQLVLEFVENNRVQLEQKRSA
jgi:DNA invertase Pin-like site-specific DNA recombinase